MADPELSSAPVKSQKYNPDTDAPRMRAYMAEKRAKDKAGFKHMTVGQYRKHLAG